MTVHIADPSLSSSSATVVGPGSGSSNSNTGGSGGGAETGSINSNVSSSGSDASNADDVSKSPAKVSHVMKTTHLYVVKWSQDWCVFSARSIRLN